MSFNILSKSKKIEYIWHCPGKKCKDKGMVLLKTTVPFLGDGKIKCQRCEKEFDFRTVMKFNHRNIKKFLKELDSN